jgi:serine/threonine protein phosphatase PrpC
MSAFETTSITVPYRDRCEDRVKVINFDDGVVIAVADGAGGIGAGDEAAEAVIREITAAASLTHDETAWCSILEQIDFRVGVGESTGVVVACSARGLVGACVGDSQAWLIADGEIQDLTESRVRKPLLGSGEAVPTGFSCPALNGLLIVATDGFFNYVRREQLLKDVLWIDFHVLARKLVEMIRLPSGDLWDDVGIVACRPRPKSALRRRYNLGNGD